jgi:hypothetical protein
MVKSYKMITNINKNTMSTNQTLLSSHNARKLSTENSQKKIIGVGSDTQTKNKFQERCEKELELYNNNDLQLKINKCIGVLNDVQDVDNVDIKNFNKCRNEIEKNINLGKFQTSCYDLGYNHKILLKELGFRVNSNYDQYDSSNDYDTVSWNNRFF